MHVADLESWEGEQRELHAEGKVRGEGKTAEGKEGKHGK